MNDAVIQWKEQLVEDYPEALIRLATARGDKKHYLLFAWVELFPFDMSAPSGWSAGAKPWPIPGHKGWTCGFTARKCKTRDALDWYEAAARGDVRLDLEGMVTAEAVALLAEPAYGQFSVGVALPFAFPWHDGPRIQRQVPMVEVPLSIRALGRSPALRDWLLNNLNFDPFEHDEWLGALALVAPDPVCSKVATFQSESDDGGNETLTIYGSPRRNGQRGIADLSTLSVIVAQRRVSGWSSLEVLKLDSTGYAAIRYPQPSDQVGYAVICARRGLLRLVEPLPWLNQVGVDIGLVTSQREVRVPTGGRRKPKSSFTVANQTKGPSILVGQAATDSARIRLFRLRERTRLRRKRFDAPQKLFGVTSVNPTNQERVDRRQEAEDFVAHLVAGARRRVMLVDPFFGPRETRQFALRNPHQSVNVKILTGLRGLLGEAPDASVPGTLLGDVFAADLQHLTKLPNVSSPQVRVMPGGVDSIIHDRYLIVDDTVWHCGPSFNELGERIGVMVLLPAPLAIRRLVSKVWSRSTALGDYWKAYKEAAAKRLEPPPDET
ncbi:VPA1262 family N-terminal domain-containing protein [Paraburkholderia sp. C35]|uniref:VPA1262 family N-terminal domain-containing protein n=1 Tax=Paraburkholderia sp. C35 TaxID=2126993 RepID=UPI000D690CF0|nr:VPA1262 family N-terminal domain-containing protein [Paraburkholderia sp. C35]